MRAFTDRLILNTVSKINVGTIDFELMYGFFD